MSFAFGWERQPSSSWGQQQRWESPAESSSWWRSNGNRCPPPCPPKCKPRKCKPRKCPSPCSSDSESSDDCCKPCKPKCCKPKCCKPKCCTSSCNNQCAVVLASTGTVGTVVPIGATPFAVPLTATVIPPTPVNPCDPCCLTTTPFVTFTSSGFLVNQQISATITATTNYNYSPALALAGSATTYILVNGVSLAQNSNTTSAGATTASGGLATLTTTLAAGSIVQLGASAAVGTTTIASGSFLNLSVTGPAGCTVSFGKCC